MKVNVQKAKTKTADPQAQLKSFIDKFDSENQVESSGQQRPFARVAKDGRLVPEVLQVISGQQQGIIAGHDRIKALRDCQA